MAHKSVFLLYVNVRWWALWMICCWDGGRVGCDGFKCISIYIGFRGCRPTTTKHASTPLLDAIRKICKQYRRPVVGCITMVIMVSPSGVKTAAWIPSQTLNRSDGYFKLNIFWGRQKTMICCHQRANWIVTARTHTKVGIPDVQKNTQT